MGGGWGVRNSKAWTLVALAAAERRWVFGRLPLPGLGRIEPDDRFESRMETDDGRPERLGQI